MKQFSFLLVFFLSLPAFSATITVPVDYGTIQDAIDAANNGDTVFIIPGIYEETLRIEKSITLRGSDRENTIIDGMGSDYVIFGNVPNLTIENLTIKNAVVCIELDGSDNSVIQNCNVGYSEDLGSGEYLYGIRFLNSKNGKISQNKIIKLAGGINQTVIGILGISIESILIEKKQIFSLKGGNGSPHGSSAIGVMFDRGVTLTSKTLLE